MYQEVIEHLRTSYDGSAGERDGFTKPDWKVAERAAFLTLVRARRCERLLEIGAGTGQDSLFFKEHGLEVLATDLSPAMVELCRAKGLDARVADFLSLGSGPFDAVYSFNCLLHVPNADLPAVLERIRAVLRPGGLFFLGVYGGGDNAGTEGIAEWDHHEPKRFFSWRTDGQLQAFATAAGFEVVDFHVVNEGDYRFQSLTLSIG